MITSRYLKSFGHFIAARSNRLIRKYPIWGKTVVVVPLNAENYGLNELRQLRSLILVMHERILHGRSPITNSTDEWYTGVLALPTRAGY